MTAAAEMSLMTWTQEELDHHVRADPCEQCGAPGHTLEISDIMHDRGLNEVRVRCPECAHEDTRGLPGLEEGHRC